jgi:cell pole-organizing protein PopZ
MPKTSLVAEHATLQQDETAHSMSTSQTPPGSGPGTGTGAGAGAGTASSGDPSMEDILASIRRILSEDEVTPGSAMGSASGAASGAQAAPPEHEAAGSGVLVLDPAMMVPEPPEHADPVPEPMPQKEAAAAVIAQQGLVAPEAAAAAASSVDSLVRTLAVERTMQVRSGGPTVEDIVREELRPLLKAWLDANLPPLVERLVRTEIERVVGRAAP